jgi:D-ornithine 4,5-aminomutase subunit alpha
MSSLENKDDFNARRAHLQGLSDAQLHAYFWELAEKIVAPIVNEARTHTSPSIERSVLMRMGFSSIETRPIVDKMAERGLLGHGAGNLVLKLAHKKKISVREAGLALMRGEHWQELPL